MAHVSPKAFPEESIAVLNNPLGMRGRQAPVLAFRRKEIGRRADGCAVCKVLLKHPGICSMGIDPDREVGIQPNRHAGAPCRRLNALELFMALPFQIAIQDKLMRSR